MTMRFMVMVKADKNSEAGVLPDEKLLTEMGKYNEELVKAGVLLACEGLQPSSKGARVQFSGEKRTVIDGPFTEAKELIAGFWLWQVKSREEAIEWVKRCPNPTGTETEIEIRQVFEAEDWCRAHARAQRGGGAHARTPPEIRQAVGREAVITARCDVGLAEELAQDALVTAKHRTVDLLRRRKLGIYIGRSNKGLRLWPLRPASRQIGMGRSGNDRYPVPGR
jgi:hypothetical protein